MYFESSLEYCGRSINLVFQRAQSARIRQRKIVCENGIIIKNKVDIHYVDYNITDTNDVRSKDPKFQLKIFFENCLFLVIEKLVCGGDTFEGFAPVIPVYNDGPHQGEECSGI